MISVRAIPGAGKNFIATLLSKHYNTNTTMYYDSLLNEYFHNPDTVIDPNGNIIQPFWNGNTWDILSSREITHEESLNIINHEHEWFDDGSDVVRKFVQFHQSDGAIGLNPLTFYKDIREGYFIYCDKHSELIFAKKLLDMKQQNGSRPSFLIDNIITEYDIEVDRLRALSSTGKMWDFFRLIQSINEKMKLTDWINLWERYCMFLEQLPFNNPMSIRNIKYLSSWLLDDMKWELCNVNNYLARYEFIDENYKLDKVFDSTNELKKLDKARSVAKETGMILHEINYSDFFFDQKDTGTVLDCYKKEVAEYTAKNIEILDQYEQFYGLLSK